MVRLAHADVLSAAGRDEEARAAIAYGCQRIHAIGRQITDAQLGRAWSAFPENAKMLALATARLDRA
jgi:hypothetical protein